MITNRDYEAINAAIRSWTGATQNVLKSNISMMSNKGKGELLRLTHEYFRAFGEINRISFRFPKHGVFFQKGVGRGYRSKNGNVYKVSPSRTIGMNRQPKDWFNSTLDERVPLLGEMLADKMANAVVNAMNAQIK